MDKKIEDTYGPKIVTDKDNSNEDWVVSVYEVCSGEARKAEIGRGKTVESAYCNALLKIIYAIRNLSSCSGMLIEEVKNIQEKYIKLKKE